MRRTRLVLLAAAVSAVPLAAAQADEPKAPASPEAIVEYYEGPAREFDKDLKTVRKRATKALKAKLKKKPKKPAIVFDIDDTLESTYRCAKESNFDRTAISACQARTDQDPIKPVWRLLKYAKKRKVAIIVITGRPVGIESATREQLRRDGLRGKYTLVMRPNSEFGQDSAPYKAAARKRLQRKRKLKIVLNIGDQQSDLSGGASGKRFKVPNPMYFTP
jgi:predicted secreted acid phosphatase